MSYTLDDFRKEIAREVINELAPGERLGGLTRDQILCRLPTKEFVKFFTPEQLLEGVSVEQIEAYLEQMRSEANSPPAKTLKPKR